MLKTRLAIKKTKPTGWLEQTDVTFPIHRQSIISLRFYFLLSAFSLHPQSVTLYDSDYLLRGIEHYKMKIIKIIFGVLAALWALAYIPKITTGISHSDGSFASSRISGSVAGCLIATAISIALFRSAFKK
jgi:hypothetical protein